MNRKCILTTHEEYSDPPVEAKPAATAPTPDGKTLAAAAASSSDLTGRPEMRGIEFDQIGNDGGIGNVLQSAMHEQGEDTIFKQVSRKYRSLSAAFARKAM